MKNQLKHTYRFPLIRFAIIVPIALCAIFAFAATVSALCPEHITAYWNLDDTDPSATGVNDSTGNGLTGFCTSCPTYMAEGRIKHAQQFDGLATEITVPPDSAFDWGLADSFSVEFWMKPDSNLNTTVAAIGRIDLPGGGSHR